jgi:hypothetical protein
MTLRVSYFQSYSHSIKAAMWKQLGTLSHHLKEDFPNHVRLGHEQEIDLVGLSTVEFLEKLI